MGITRTAIALSFTLLLTPLLSASPTLWPTNGHSYEAISVPGSHGITWLDAQADAVARGGYLATISSQAENDFVYSLVTDSAFWHPSNAGTAVGPWIGALQPPGSPEPAGNWQWITGEPFSYTNWCTYPSIQPTNTNGNEDHIHFIGIGSTKSSTWNDLPNIPPTDWYVKGYIVESVPEPTTLSLLILAPLSLLTRRRSARL